MEDLLLTFVLLSRCGTGPILLYENHKCRCMKNFRLAGAMQVQLFDFFLLSQCRTGRYRCVKSSVLSMDDIPRHDKFSCATAMCCLVTSGVRLDYQFPMDITELVP